MFLMIKLYVVESFLVRRLHRFAVGIGGGSTGGGEGSSFPRAQPGTGDIGIMPPSLFLLLLLSLLRREARNYIFRTKSLETYCIYMCISK